jgi:transcriptional regulator with XRE-family HTH domain
MPKDKQQQVTITKEKKAHVVPDIDRDYIKKIAAKVKELRIKAGYSSYESFAFHAGINRNSYFRLERSAVSGDNFTVALLLRVIRGLNTTTTEFFQQVK